MIKVYCKNCKYFNDWGKPINSPTCNAPENLEWDENYRSIFRIYKNDPWTLNENNDCKLYRRRGYPRILDLFKKILKEI